MYEIKKCFAKKSLFVLHATTTEIEIKNVLAAKMLHRACKTFYIMLNYLLFKTVITCEI